MPDRTVIHGQNGQLQEEDQESFPEARTKETTEIWRVAEEVWGRGGGEGQRKEVLWRRLWLKKNPKKEKKIKIANKREEEVPQVHLQEGRRSWSEVRLRYPIKD